MPLFRRKTARVLRHLDPEDWRPQRFGGRGFRAIADPIIEPQWGGLRVLVRVATGRTRIEDEDGHDATAEFAEVVEAIAAAALAEELILDGYLTVEPTQPSCGVDLPALDRPTPAGVAAQMLIGGRPRANRPGEPVEPARPIDPDRPIAFVAVDLLSIDGTGLVELPLLERKRLLDSALSVGELVRITPFVRPPVGTFLATWQASGLRGLAYKAANSRYAPGLKNPEWASTPMPSPRA
jgi:hypothetical protein